MKTPALMAAAYREEMDRLLDAVDRIPVELLSAPIHGDWTIRELLVHLAAWDRAVTASADDVLAARPARLTAMRLEDVNEEIVDSWRGRTLDEARQELAAAHRALLERVEGLSLEQWQTAPPGQHWRDGSSMTLASVFAYRYRGQTHYGGHADEIEEWLASRPARVRPPAVRDP
jgi:uncharacterized damage-inducible protein DinB